MNAETQAALALIAAGVPPSSVERCLRLIDVSATDSAETIADKVAEAKEDLPSLFGAPGDGVTSLPRHRPAGPKPSGSPTPMADARKRAQERFKSTQRPLGAPPGGSAA